MIQVSNLSKKYGSYSALKNLSFSASKGEILGLLGPNGAGKTTTLKILTGVFPPDSGSVKVDGLDIGKDSLKIRKRLGYLPETNPLYPELRVREFLAFRAKIKKVPRKIRNQRIQTVLKQCLLEDVSQRIIGTLSKGVKQRIGLAEALVSDPAVLILDEPTIGLDPHQLRKFRQLIQKLASSRTILFSSHILSEVESICSRVVILNRGEKVAEGEPGKLGGTSVGAKLNVEIKAPLEDCLDAIREIPHILQTYGERVQNNGWSRIEVEVEQGIDLREDFFQLVKNKGWVLRELKTASRSLEDTFVALTREEGINE